MQKVLKIIDLFVSPFCVRKFLRPASGSAGSPGKKGLLSVCRDFIQKGYFEFIRSRIIFSINPE